MSLPALLAAAIVAASPAPAPQPPVGHVFTIVLENKDYEQTFGADSRAPYLANELSAKGTLLTNYYGTGHLSLDNYITMVSGQAPNPVTQSDCQYFQAFLPGTIGPEGQALGAGCVYPAEVETVAGQLKAKGLRYRGYMEDMGADPAREPATCAHPAVDARDGTQKASATDQYATRHNPFVYFHSIIDDQASCDRDVVGLHELTQDLASTATTPAYSFITPDLCSDGHDDTCPDPEQKGGYEGIDAFLRTWVPRITTSPAFRQDGLLVITFDEAEGDSTACCDEPTGPNTPRPGINGAGGGRVGALLLGPSVAAGRRIDAPINHYGYLRSVEDLFGLDHLGYAAHDANTTFQAMGAFTASAGTPAAPARPIRRFRVHRRHRRLVIRVRLAAGVTGKLSVRRHGHVVRRARVTGRAVVRAKVRRRARVVLRAGGVTRVKRR